MAKNQEIHKNRQIQFSRLQRLPKQPKPLKTQEILRSLTSCQNFAPNLKYINILLIKPL